MTAPHWKVYEPIRALLQSDERGIAPFVGHIQVTAIVNPSAAELRIKVAIGTLSAASLTVAQVDELIDLLQRAKADVAAGKEHGDVC